jgi:hypothetical protein
MAKMFYSLEEASQRLGVSEEQLKQMAAGGKLQQFRDRDKLMFKRDQVDAMVARGGSGVAPAQDSGGPIPLADSHDTDRIDLKADSAGPAGRKEDPRQATGISVFDADEIEPADPMAQTQVTQPVTDEDLALESVGSGSGLLDLTRESDDTSLGAELLDEIYPGGEASDAKNDAKPSTAVLEGVSSEAGSGSGLENLEPAGAGAPVEVMVAASETWDPADVGLGLGLLVPVFAGLVLALVVAWSAAVNVPSNLASKLAESPAMAFGVPGGILVASILFGVIGFVVGKGKR